MLPAIGGAENDASRNVRIRQRKSAGGPAILRVEEADRFEPAIDAGGLLLPMLAAVGRVPDRAAIADRPAMLGIDERHVAQASIGPRDERDRVARGMFQRTIVGKHRLPICDFQERRQQRAEKNRVSRTSPAAAKPPGTRSAIRSSMT